MNLAALFLVIYLVFIPVSFITCVSFNWHEGDDLTLKELGSIMVASIIPLVNILMVILIISNVSDKVLIKGRNKNEPS